MNITVETLPCGVRLAHFRAPWPVEYTGVAVDAGSRDEIPGEYGLAHFVEHTIFKGTPSRPAPYVARRMEAVGGELNAYTTKEETMIYTVAPAPNMRRSLQLVADLICDSSFPPHELDLEREVVLDEINSYLDSPADSVLDDFDDLIFAESPLGHNILGSVETVRRFDTADCRSWLERFYTPGRIVVFYCGPESPERFKACAERYFEPLSDRKDTPSHRTVPGMLPAFSAERSASRHQAHTVMGARIPGIYSPDNLPIQLINNLIGGPGMNARLNIALRERRGLVYAIDSAASLYTDSGLLTIYFGCDPSDTPKCRQLVCSTLRTLASQGLTQRQLAAARRQYAGQLIVAAESHEQTSLGIARSVLRGIKPLETPELLKRVEGISLDHLDLVLALFHPDRFSSLTLS